MEPAGEIGREHLVGIPRLQLDREEAMPVRAHGKLIELPELGLIHPGADDLSFHGFVFRRREAMAAEYVRVYSHALTQTFMQLTPTCEIRAIMT